MSRDFWQTKRPVRPVDKLKKSITLPAATYTTFRRVACLEYNVADANNNFSIFTEIFTGTFTFECWIKPLSNAVTKQVILKHGDNAGTPQFEFSILGTTLSAKVWRGGIATVINTINTVFPFTWNHIAATYDSINFKLYLNGVQVATTPLAGPADFGQVFFHVAQSAASTDLYIGRIGEIRVWSVARTADQILNFYRNPRNAGMDDVTGLIHYFKCNGVTLVGGNEGDQIDVVRTINASSTKFISTDGPPLIFGASYIAAEAEIDLGKSISFMFPVSRPDGCTGQLGVRWNDEDGVTQHRKFWSVDGVDINPPPLTYMGEEVTAPFVLEWWNIDGNETLEVPEDFVLYVSDTTSPTTSYDHTNIVAETPIIDTTLGEPFPWNFPLAFNSPQIYV